MATSNAVSGVAQMMQLVWRLFTDVKLPFINLSPAVFVISMFVLGGIFAVAKTLLGFSIGTIGSLGGRALRDARTRSKEKRAASYARNAATRVH